jgi:PAS domain S-box-containing protein
MSMTGKPLPKKGRKPARSAAESVKKPADRQTPRVIPPPPGTPSPIPDPVSVSAADPKLLRVLIVEDLEDDAFLMVRELTRYGYRVEYLRVDTPAGMTEALRTRTWDLVLSDHSMPKFSAPDALALLRKHGLDLPFIIVSGSIGEDLAVAAMKAGASDYFRKDSLTRLAPAVERELREAEIRKARAEAEDALRQSEVLYRTLVNTSPDAIVVTDLEARVRMANPQALRLLGWNFPDSHLGRKWTETFSPQQIAQIGTILDSIRETGRQELTELMIGHPSAPQFRMELSGTLLPDSAGHPDAILFILHDITTRKQAEEQIRRQLDRLAALRTIDAAITASLDLRVTLMVILDALTSQLGVDAADFYLLHPQSQSLQYAAGRGFRSLNQRDQFINLGRGHAGRAALERRLILVSRLDETPDDPARTAALRAEGFVSQVAAPLLSKGQVKGVMEVFHRGRLDPEPEWLSYLETMAEQAAIAIDNAVLFEDLQRSNVELTLAYDATIEGWSHALDLRDRETEGHTRRVTDATLRMARIIGIPETELVHVRRGCLLHDIGKMAIPDGILLKPGPLSEEEWVTMRRHPAFAFELLSPINFLRPTMDIPYCHHEKFDGSGYPRGLKADHIPLAARIFTLVDVWDALRSDRPYRKAWPDDRIRDHMLSLANIHFDPDILRPFLDLYLPAAGPEPAGGQG